MEGAARSPDYPNNDDRNRRLPINGCSMDMLVLPDLNRISRARCARKFRLCSKTSFARYRARCRPACAPYRRSRRKLISAITRDFLCSSTGLRLRFHKRQQVGIDGLCLGGRHAVWEVLIGL
jgi:hypothetical protein